MEGSKRGSQEGSDNVQSGANHPGKHPQQPPHCNAENCIHSLGDRAFLQRGAPTPAYIPTLEPCRTTQLLLFSQIPRFYLTFSESSELLPTPQSRKCIKF